MMKKTAALLAVLLLAIGLYAASLPPEQPPCVKASLADLAERFNITAERGAIRALYCATYLDAFQYEIEGRDASGRPFHALHTESGEALSGADHVREDCLIISGNKTFSRRVTGAPLPVVSESDCRLDTSAFGNPVSSYRFP
jgi:hypothetical protein